jgi:hypothetical protein
MFMQPPLGDSFADTMMMTPKTKRYFRDPGFMDSPFASSDLFLPTEIEKLKKLFPLLDSKVTNSIPPTLPLIYSNLKTSSMSVIKSAVRPMTRSLQRSSENNKKNNIKKLY